MAQTTFDSSGGGNRGWVAPWSYKPVPKPPASYIGPTRTTYSYSPASSRKRADVVYDRPGYSNVGATWKPAPRPLPSYAPPAPRRAVFYEAPPNSYAFVPAKPRRFATPAPGVPVPTPNYTRLPTEMRRGATRDLAYRINEIVPPRPRPQPVPTPEFVGPPSTYLPLPLHTGKWKAPDLLELYAITQAERHIRPEVFSIPQRVWLNTELDPDPRRQILGSYAPEFSELSLFRPREEKEELLRRNVLTHELAHAYDLTYDHQDKSVKSLVSSGFGPALVESMERWRAAAEPNMPAPYLEGIWDALDYRNQTPYWGIPEEIYARNAARFSLNPYNIPVELWPYYAGMFAIDAMPRYPVQPINPRSTPVVPPLTSSLRPRATPTPPPTPTHYPAVSTPPPVW